MPELDLKEPERYLVVALTGDSCDLDEDPLNIIGCALEILANDAKALRDPIEQNHCRECRVAGLQAASLQGRLHALHHFVGTIPRTRGR